MRYCICDGTGKKCDGTRNGSVTWCELINFQRGMP
jgi:hypothetical protein